MEDSKLLRVFLTDVSSLRGEEAFVLPKGFGDTLSFSSSISRKCRHWFVVAKACASFPLVGGFAKVSTMMFQTKQKS